MNTTTTSELSISQIRNLIQSVDQKGSRLACVFRCPETGKSASATVDIVEANGSFKTKAKARVRESAIRSITRSVGRTLRGLLGNNVVGRLAGEVVKDQSKAMASQGGFDAAELDRATVAAFEQVQQQFTWNEGESRFVHASALKG